MEAPKTMSPGVPVVSALPSAIDMRTAGELCGVDKNSAAVMLMLDSASALEEMLKAFPVLDKAYKQGASEYVKAVKSEALRIAFRNDDPARGEPAAMKLAQELSKWSFGLSKDDRADKRSAKAMRKFGNTGVLFEPADWKGGGFDVPE